MNKVLILDESGSIDSPYKDERYFVLGGLLYNLDQLEIIKSKIVPSFDLFRGILMSDELKSSKMAGSKKDSQLILGAVLGIVQSTPEIKPIIYILDKQLTTIINTYDKKSFKYNKMIKYLITDLLNDKLIDENDRLLLIIDHLDFSKREHENILNWLPTQVKQVEEVVLEKSEKLNFLQLADIIAGLPKLKGNSPRLISNDTKIRVLANCYMHVFPNSKSNLVLKTTKS